METDTKKIFQDDDDVQFAYTPAAYVIIDGKKRYVRSVSSLKKMSRLRMRQNCIPVKSPDKTKMPVATADLVKDGNLLRGIIEREIYVIEKGFRKYVYPGLFHKYYGKKVWTVNDTELARIPLLTSEIGGDQNHSELAI
jgi:hypothetical protein